MTILYNWGKITRYAGHSSKRILKIFEAMLSTSIPNDIRHPLYRYKQIDFSGHSFLVNPSPLLKYRHKWRDKEIASYIGLASFRNLGEYKATGKLTLDFHLSPLREDAILNNRLLRIDTDEIHFLYEDYTGE